MRGDNIMIQNHESSKIEHLQQEEDPCLSCILGGILLTGILPELGWI